MIVRYFVKPIIQKHKMVFISALIAVFSLVGCSTKGKEGATSNLLPSNTPQPIATDTPTVTHTPSPSSTPTDTATPTVTSSPTLGIGSTMISPQDGMNLMYVPAGEFIMGLTDEEMSKIMQYDLSIVNLSAWTRLEFTFAQPQHKVYLDAFWIDQTEITNAMYSQCVAAGVCKEPRIVQSACNQYFNPDYANHPVICVEPADDKIYCEWAGRRLPTEAEWEKAARGTDGRIYPWGNQEPNGNLLNFFDKNGNISDWAAWKNNSIDDGYAITAPVGSYSQGASPYGALDMTGNVAEYVSDKPPLNYKTNMPLSTGDMTCQRMYRGGSYLSTVSESSTAFRYCFEGIPVFLLQFGFRCALSP